MRQLLRSTARRVLPAAIHQWLRARLRRDLPGDCPPVGKVDLGDLRRVTPISSCFGFDRGLPVDRHYVEAFLGERAGDISGRVLEIGDDTYTRRFGGDRVTTRDVLHVAAGNPAATVVGDLTSADHIPSDRFDCFIFTQTLHLIYNVPAALQTIRRILKPGGVLLATFPGLSQIAGDEWGESWYWGFTTQSAQRLFTEVFPVDQVEVKAHGNVLTTTAFLHGIAAEELRPAELSHRDRYYEMLITVRARKPEAAA